MNQISGTDLDDIRLGPLFENDLAYNVISTDIFLEPLFSDYPSVSHKYTSKMNSVHLDSYRFCNICDKGEVTGSIDNNFSKCLDNMPIVTFTMM